MYVATSSPLREAGWNATLADNLSDPGLAAIELVVHLLDSMDEAKDRIARHDCTWLPQVSYLLGSRICGVVSALLVENWG